MTEKSTFDEKGFKRSMVFLGFGGLGVKVYDKLMSRKNAKKHYNDTNKEVKKVLGP